MQTAPLNVLDELYLHLDREQEPWSVHLELEVEGRIDGGRLNAAVNTVGAKLSLLEAGALT